MLNVILLTEYRKISNINTRNQTPDACVLRKIFTEVDSCHKTGQERHLMKTTHIFANEFPCIYHVQCLDGLIILMFLLKQLLFCVRMYVISACEF